MASSGSSVDHELYRVGRDLKESGKLREAVIVLRASDELRSHPKTLELLAECEWALGLTASAFSHACVSFVSGPSAKPGTIIVDHLISIGEYKRAQEVLELAVRRDPNSRRLKELSESLQQLRVSSARACPNAAEEQRE